LDEAKKTQEDKKNRDLLQQIEEKARQLLHEKGHLNGDTFKPHNKPDIKLLCKSKGIKVGNVDSKQKMCGLHVLELKPPAPTTWSEDDETNCRDS